MNKRTIYIYSTKKTEHWNFLYAHFTVGHGGQYLFVDGWGWAESKLAKSAQPESSSSEAWVVVTVAELALLPAKSAQLSSLAVVVVDDTPMLANMSAPTAAAAAEFHGIGSTAIGVTSIGASSNFAQSANHTLEV